MNAFEWSAPEDEKEVPPLTERERREINADLANFQSLVDAETGRVSEKYWQAVEAVRRAGVSEEELMKDDAVRAAFEETQAVQREIEETEQEVRERLDGFRRAIGT